MFDWDDMRIFLTVARMKRVASAARVLGMDVTTINRRLSRLAQALDANPFEQIGGERVLTECGSALFQHAETIEGAALSVLEEVKGERQSLSGHVRLSVAEGFGTWILAPALAAFHRQHPRIRLDLITAPGLLDPSKREADMAVLLTRPRKGHLTVKKLADYQLHLYASPDYLTAHDPIRQPSDLKRHALIGYVPEFAAPELDYLGEVEDGLEASLRSSSINIQRDLIRRGAGVGVVPDFMAEPGSGLVRILAEHVALSRSFWLVVHQDLIKLRRIRAVIDLLTRQCQALAA